MKKIKLAVDTLLSHLGLEDAKQLNGETLAALIVNEAVIATKGQAFIIREIKCDSHWIIRFIGNTCQETLYLKEPKRSGGLTLCVKK